MPQSRMLQALGFVPLLANSWQPPPGCDNSTWSASECCCAFCEPGLTFTVKSKLECLDLGGQCKTPHMSAYHRRPRATIAVAPPESDEPEQTHLIGGYPDEVTVVYLSKSTESKVELRRAGHTQEWTGSADSYSLQMMPMGRDGYASPLPHPGAAYAKCDGSYPASYNASCVYTSGIIHTVQLRDLLPGASYQYRPAGARRWRSFQTPPAVGQPVTFGVVADLGQTTDALATMVHMSDALDVGRIHTALFPGDLSYADGFAPFWDTYGRLSEFLWERLPAAYIIGNHEYYGGWEQNVHFMSRYAWPSRARSGSVSRHWFSFDVGLAHVVMLCSYCETAEHGLQTSWLKSDLAKLDRAQTPWLIVSFHTPYYSANQGHVGEADVMRDDIEDILYQHKVDIVFTGHVHAYDRTNSMYKNKTTCDGPVYITVGDGGNHEGPYCGWRHLEWSAFTENSFGYGEFEIANASLAQWRFYRNQDNESTAADGIWLRPASKRCEVAVV